MILRPYQGKSPKIDPTAFIAENAVIIGDVEIGARASVWYNCVIRGDVNFIRIGEETSIQDGTVVHAETVQGPTLIGRRVTVGHNAIIHGCVIEDECLIGMGAIVLSYSKIGKGSLIAAGALVTEHEIVPPGTIMVGVPAKPRGQVTPEMAQRASIGCDHYLELAEQYRKG
ncbi:MAG TPA: gamma carbonic anhydrase family protein [bacterium]|nr:gamma carbonic anhydrase family protein [bacterium]